MNKLVSIIIPVYKVEKYIEKCMQSLLDQTYENFEALVVDDGSPDNSITLAKELVGDDPRFIFLEKENGGQGSARNLGLDHAKGDYIAFLDSDDSYTSDALETIVTEFSKNSNFTILCFGINKVDEQGKLIQQSYSDRGVIRTDSDVLLLKRTLTNYFCDKAYIKEHIKKFRFSTEIRTYEDVDLMYRTTYDQEIKVIPNCLYNYTQRLGSTTWSLPKTFINDKKEIVKNAEIFLKEKGIYEQFKDYYAIYYLAEMYYKPLLKIANFSENYSADTEKLLSGVQDDLLTYSNIYNLKSHHGLKSVITLSIFKTNKELLYLTVKLWQKIKEVKRK